VIVDLRGLRKRYGAVEALRGLDLQVAPGQVYGFLGRNGAGKSTALRIIMGITRPSGGEVVLFGRPQRGEDPLVRRRIGYVAQEQAFYPWMTPVSLGRFVSGFYPGWDDAEYRRLLGLLEIPAGQRIQTFSGGTHAKLALAVALAHRPELLVLDEPTAGMDAVARREFLELVRLQAQRTGRATLFSSHLIDEVELAADTVGIIDGGRMLWQGPAPALQAQFRRLAREEAGTVDGAQAPEGTVDGAQAPVGTVDGAQVPVGTVDGARAPVGAVDGARTPEGPEGELGVGPGIELLEDRREGGRRTLLVRAADPQALEARAAAAGWVVSTPSLEDVFVALVRRPVAY
jgi:ABC-2 type transport system ATP-binding protein